MPELTLNGFKHYYEEVGQGPAMVFLACTIDDNAQRWVGHMAEHAAGFRVVIPDLRGLAGSAHTTQVSPADWVSDLGGLLDRLSIPSAHIVAETLGSRVAVRFAAESPRRVRTLILNGAIAASDSAGDAWRRRIFNLASLSSERKANLQKYQGDNWPQVLEFYLTMHEREDFKGYYDLLKVAPQVQAPTLITRGDIDDEVHPVAHSVALHKAISSSWLAIYPNTPFNVMTSKTKEFWGLVRTFIAERTKQESTAS
jgi:pimeloyl-ACP methyl ester carboxylesterase